MHLPIAKYRERIVKTVNANQVTIITSPTGSGKTTQIPQYLLDEGYSMILTQPRRFAANAVAARIANETETRLGGLIGLSTRKDKNYSQDTRCLVATDGLAFMRQLMGQNTFDALLLDEKHEDGINTEVMTAMAKRAIDKNASFKLIIMSATIDAPRLSQYFDDAPVIVCEGRSFGVTRQEPGISIAHDTADCLARGLNVLVFVPGKAEIRILVKQLYESFRVDAVVLPLHAQMESVEQLRCLANYSVPKCIIATPMAQTSITIDDIDVVIDSGLENRVELYGGVAGLHERVISLATEEQRAGRVGRTKPGIFISHAPNMVVRDEYPMPEILRTRLDQLVLRLAWQGIDAAEDLSFLNQPPKEVLKLAKTSLRSLGCLTKTGKVTKKGQRVAALPVSAEGGCMLLEAEQRGVLKDMMAIVAIFEAGGIVQRFYKDKSGYSVDEGKKERESDLLAQLEVYRGENLANCDLRHSSLNVAIDVYEHMAKVLPQMLEFKETIGTRDDLIASIAAGLRNYVYYLNSRKEQNYHCGDGIIRELHRSSVVRGRGAVVGLPWDLTSDLVGKTENMLCLVTKIKPNTLKSLLT